LDAPEFLPASGSQVSFPLSVQITTNIVGGHVHYTLDGTTPDENSPIYAGPVIVFSEDTVLKAIACTPPTNCVECCSAVATGEWDAIPEGQEILFRLVCPQPEADRAGSWEIFAPDGNPDRVFTLNITLGGAITIKRLDIIALNELGWTGKMWSTDSPVDTPIPPGVPFLPWPLVVFKDGAKINFANGEPLVVVPMGDSEYTLYTDASSPGPVATRFKLILTWNDDSTYEATIDATCGESCTPGQPDCSYTLTFTNNTGYVINPDGPGGIVVVTNQFGGFSVSPVPTIQPGASWTADFGVIAVCPIYAWAMGVTLGSDEVPTFGATFCPEGGQVLGPPRTYSAPAPNCGDHAISLIYP